jgi:hypothetical protein
MDGGKARERRSFPDRLANGSSTACSPDYGEPALVTGVRVDGRRFEPIDG